MQQPTCCVPLSEVQHSWRSCPRTLAGYLGRAIMRQRRQTSNFDSTSCHCDVTHRQTLTAEARRRGLSLAPTPLICQSKQCLLWQLALGGLANARQWVIFPPCGPTVTATGVKAATNAVLHSSCATRAQVDCVHESVSLK